MRKYFRLLLACLVGIFFSSQFIYAAESEPEPGGSCNEPDAIYNYVSDISKTPWKMNELYAVPVGTSTPSDWVLSPNFKTQFTSELQSGEDPHAFAEACAGVWQDYFTAETTVLFTVDRTITTTHMTLKCESGVWNTLSTEDQEFNDVSDWLSANSNPFNVNDTQAVTLLENDLQNVLTNLNAQPGAN